MYPVQCNPRTIRTGVGRPWASWRRSSSSVPPGKASSGPSLGSLGPVATPTIIRGVLAASFPAPGVGGWTFLLEALLGQTFFLWSLSWQGTNVTCPLPPSQHFRTPACTTGPASMAAIRATASIKRPCGVNGKGMESTKGPQDGPE